MDPFNPTPDLHVRPSRGLDVNALAPRLRPEDVAEIVAASGETAVLALGRGFLASNPCWTVLYHGEPSAMFGVVPSEGVEFARLGRVWFLGSTSVPLWGKSFTRLTNLWLLRMGQDFDILGCTVDARQLAHLRWLRAVGFNLVTVHRNFGYLELPFVEMAVTLEELRAVQKS